MEKPAGATPVGISDGKQAEFLRNFCSCLIVTVEYNTKNIISKIFYRRRIREITYFVWQQTLYCIPRLLLAG